MSDDTDFIPKRPTTRDRVDDLRAKLRGLLDELMGARYWYGINNLYHLPEYKILDRIFLSNHSLLFETDGLGARAIPKLLEAIFGPYGLGDGTRGPPQRIGGLKDYVDQLFSGFSDRVQSEIALISNLIAKSGRGKPPRFKGQKLIDLLKQPPVRPGPRPTKHVVPPPPSGAEVASLFGVGVDTQDGLPSQSHGSGGGTPSRGDLPGGDREPRPEKEPSGSGGSAGSAAPETSSPAPSGPAPKPTLNAPSTTAPKPAPGEDIDQAQNATLAPPETPAPKPEPKPKEEPEREEKGEDVDTNQNTTYDNPQEDGGGERPIKRVFIPTATDKFLLIAALRAAKEVNRRTPKPGTDTGWQPFGSGSVARAPEHSSGSYLPDAAAGQMMMASSYEGAGRSRFRSPATDGPDQVPLGAARQRDRSNGRGVMSWFRPNPDDPSPSPRPNARARQG